MIFATFKNENSKVFILCGADKNIIAWTSHKEAVKAFRKFFLNIYKKKGPLVTVQHYAYFNYVLHSVAESDMDKLEKLVVGDDLTPVTEDKDFGSVTGIECKGEKTLVFRKSGVPLDINFHKMQRKASR